MPDMEKLEMTGEATATWGRRAQKFGQFRRHRRAAHAVHEAGIGRTDHQVGADSVGSLSSGRRAYP